MDIIKFHPVREGVLENLNWVAILASNMGKHPLAMFLNDKK
jgi:hypothetical protein